MEDELEQRAADYLSSVLSFNGERIDPVLGGYHLGNGYRLYSPSLRRFTSPDSMSPFGQGGINPYAYCEGDPINNTDPTGRLKVSIFRSVGDLALGIAIDDPELIADAALRDEEGHLGARASRQAASEATRPRSSSVSAEAERATRPGMVREDRDIREAQRPGPSNIRPHPSTDTRMRGFLAELNSNPDVYTEGSLQAQQRILLQANADIRSIMNGFQEKRESYETSRRMLKDLNPLRPWMSQASWNTFTDIKTMGLRSVDLQQAQRLRDERIAAMEQELAQITRTPRGMQMLVKVMVKKNAAGSPFHPLHFMSDFFDD